MTTPRTLKSGMSLAGLIVLGLSGPSTADVILSTDFTGRAVNGKTAGNIPWTVAGVQDPGDLTWVLEGGGPTNTALFDTANAQDHFAPDLNIGNEGPWSVTIPLSVTAAQVVLEEAVLDWQHFNNAGAFQGVDRSADWTVTVTGSLSGEIGSATALNVTGRAGLETLVFDPAPTLNPNETYQLTILVNGTTAIGNNTGLDAITFNGIVDLVPDTTPPAVAGFGPDAGAAGVPTYTDLTLIFDEPVRKGSGAIEIRSSGDGGVVETIEVSSARVRVDGASVTIDPATDLAGQSGFYVVMAEGAFVDASGNAFPGIAGAATWNFTTAVADTTAPQVLTLNPLPQERDVSRGAHLVLTFDEVVVPGSGMIEIRRSGDDTLVESIEVGAGSVSVSGMQVTIDPGSFLEGRTRYHVLMETGFVADLSGNPSAAIADPATWSFVTEPSPLLAVEFNEDDQDGFDLWPSPFAGTVSTAEFATDPARTSGTTSVTVTTSTGFGVPANRGALVDGSPAGFTFAGLYQDLLHAQTPTGFLTLDVGGLNPGKRYRFTLYAWDPGATDATDKEWTVTGGSGEPSVLAVNFQDPLVDNDSFALVFEITATEEGTLQLTNTDGLPQSAINGFTLDSLEGDSLIPFDVTGNGEELILRWSSQSGMYYVLRSSTDPAAEPAAWEAVNVPGSLEVDGLFRIAQAAPENVHALARPGDDTRFYRVEEYRLPPLTLLSENFDGTNAGGLPAGWTSGFEASDTQQNTRWELGDPAGGPVTAPMQAFSGTHCVGTNLLANYGTSSHTWLRTPVIDLSEAGAATVRFQQWVDIDEFLDLDYGTLRVLASGSLAELAVVDATVNGLSLSGWEDYRAQLPAEALGQPVVLEFGFVSDGDGVFDAAGWYVDDLVVTTPAP